jgi:hypothetical protein
MKTKALARDFRRMMTEFNSSAGCSGSVGMVLSSASTPDEPGGALGAKSVQLPTMAAGS